VSCRTFKPQPWSAGSRKSAAKRSIALKTTRPEIGAPIENLSLSREVRFDDLDLRTSGGAIALRDRVRQAALNLCQQLENQYVAMDDSRPCYRTAYDDAMDQVDAAVQKAHDDAQHDRRGCARLLPR
jgi:UrcA family protein